MELVFEVVLVRDVLLLSYFNHSNLIENIHTQRLIRNQKMIVSNFVI